MNSVASLPLLDSFAALADPARVRMLSLLDRQELTVGELCDVLQLPQSTVSRHLKTLADAGWVQSRKDGTSRYYALTAAEADESRTQIWEVTRKQLAGRPGVEQDARRLDRVLARRSETSQHFFQTSAGQWDRLREDLFGREFAVHALLGLLPSTFVVGDLGCGTGVTVATLAPHVARVIGVDGSEEMLGAARARLRAIQNVELRRGSLEALPVDSSSLDAATLMLVLHHLPSPALALSEAARVLKPGGKLLIVDMAPHEHEEYRQQMGHVWLGFSTDHIARLIEQAGFANVKTWALPTSSETRGPGLFVAVAVRP